jgi:hypothetical protein
MLKLEHLRNISGLTADTNMLAAKLLGIKN